MRPPRSSPRASNKALDPLQYDSGKSKSFSKIRAQRGLLIPAFRSEYLAEKGGGTDNGKRDHHNQFHEASMVAALTVIDGVEMR